MKEPRNFRPLCLLTCGLILTPLSGTAAIIMENWSSTPWSLTGGATSFSATVTDPVYNGGTSATFTYSNPKENVDISDPEAPDDSAASASIFGVESSGFGIAESNVGRFDRDESFTFQADHAFELNGISWAEYQGDESIYIKWTSAGVQMSEVFDLDTGSFYTTTAFNDISIDANTAVTITNVSESSAGAAGRLRIKQIIVELVDDAVLPEVGETHRLENWMDSPWNLVSGDTTFTGSVSDSTLGSVSVSFSNPMAGINVSDPDQPDFSLATASLFGAEGSGFGVNETYAGRFDKGESFEIYASQPFTLENIRFAEYSGDEALHLEWISDGLNMSTTVSMSAGSFYTIVPFIGINVDANTSLEITNVSDSSAGANGRLRVNYMDIAFLSAGAPPEPGDVLGAYMIMNQWDSWPWNGVGGDTTLSGTMLAPENGGTSVNISMTAQVGVDVSTPASPDFSSATPSIFGFEGTGFGVGESNVGRFDRGESITITSDHAIHIDNIRWRELQGDEQVHLSWTQEGVTHEEVLSLPTALTNFEDFEIDANTDLVITNVSPSSSPGNGRLRVEEIMARGIYTSAPYYDASGPDGFQQMTGVNLAGAEFGGYAFWQNDPAQWDYYSSKNLDLIRIPFKWERIQSSLYATVDFTDLDVVVALAHARGMKVILDMHNYARYNGNVIGTTSVPNAAFEDVWRQIADHYKNETAIYGYGIMNEPHGTGGLWPAAAQAAADGVRDVDTNNWIIVGGENWSNAGTWRRDNADLNVIDPSDKVIYEAHSYFDSSYPSSDGSYGSYDSENPAADIGVRRVNPFILWLQEHNARGYIGEYGTPKDDIRWNPILDNFMSHIHAYGLSGTYWAGGKNWGNYPLDCSPTNNYTTDAIQMDVLENYTD